MKKAIIFFGILMFVLGISSQVWAAGLAVDPSRTILGAKQLAMGRSGIALEQDPWLIFLNPSGLAKIKYPKGTLSSRKIFFEETQYFAWGGAVPTDWGTLALGYIGANIANSPQTTRDPGTNRIIINPSLEALSYDNSVIFLGYAKNDVFRKDLSLGANLKLYRQAFSGGSSINASAYGLDLAAQYQALPYLRVGGVYQNFLSSSLKWNSSGEAENALGGYIKIGTRLNILGQTGEALRKFDQKLIGTLNIDLPRSVLERSDMAYHLGFEWFPLKEKNISFRTGMDSNQGISYGLGFKNWGFRFDYAYAISPHGSGDNPHYFTLSYLGDLKKVITRKLVDERVGFTLKGYQDKSITTKESISLKGRATYDKVYKQKTSWVVPLVSEKHEFKEVTEKADLSNVKINKKPLKKSGSFEVTENLHIGRNLFYLQGKTPKKGTTYEAVRILRTEPFNDVPENYWAFRPISLTNTIKIIKGYPGHLFKPEKGISRAELVTLLLRTKGYNVENIEILENPFTDLKENFWGTPFVLKGVQMNLVTGYPDKTFKPKKVLSRAEGVTIISRFAKLSEEAKAAFPDLKEGYWANKYIYPAKKAGLLRYLKGKDFEPSKEFSRAEATEVLYLTKEIQKKVDLFWAKGGAVKKVEVSAKTKTTSKEVKTKLKK